MLTCKLCETVLTQKHLRKDGSLQCPNCGQIYWKSAVDKAGGISAPRQQTRMGRRTIKTA